MATNTGRTATIDGVTVPVVILDNGSEAVQPPYAGGGYVLSDQFHLLSRAVFH